MWMETVTSLALQPHLLEEYITVGIRIDITQMAFVPVGDTIQLEVNVSNVDGNFVDFHILAARDAISIGKAEHRRAIVSRKLIQRQLSKNTSKLGTTKAARKVLKQK